MIHRHATLTQRAYDPLGNETNAANDRPSWHSVNITPVERLGRVGIGLSITMVGIVLLSGAGSFIAVVLEGLLVATGLDLLITGPLGRCPLYRKLGYLPQSLQGPR